MTDICFIVLASCKQIWHHVYVNVCDPNDQVGRHSTLVCHPVCLLLTSFMAYYTTLKMEVVCSCETSVRFTGLHGVQSQKAVLFNDSYVRGFEIFRS
jgi:hypothetical protein